MKMLISAEWYKLFHNKVLLFIIGGVIAQTLLVIALYHTANRPLGPGQTGIMMLVNTSLFSQIWILAFVAYFISSEFQNGAMRNILALGKDRTHVYISKLFSTCFATSLILIIVAIVSTVGLTAFYGFGDMNFSEFLRYFTTTFFMQFMYHLPHAAVFLTVAFLSRSLGMTLMLGIGYWIVNANVPSILRALNVVSTIEYFPDYYISRFASLHSDPRFITDGFIVSAVYILIAGIVSCIVFKKSDVK